MSNCSDSLLGSSPMPSRRPARPLDPRRMPRQDRSQDTVRALREAAARIFASRGYAGATTNHIAALAGVSIGSLYEYFPNKDALLVALLEEHLTAAEMLLTHTAAETLADPYAGLRDVVGRFVRAMIALHAHEPALHRVLFEEAPLPPRVRQRLARIEERVTTEVAAWCGRHPEVHRPDPQLAAAIVVQTIEALTHTLVVHRHGALDVDACAGEVTTLVTAYLTTPVRSGGAPSRRPRSGAAPVPASRAAAPARHAAPRRSRPAGRAPAPR
jgi:AcrR family transcriptional regulator